MVLSSLNRLLMSYVLFLSLLSQYPTSISALYPKTDTPPPPQKQNFIFPKNNNNKITTTKPDPTRRSGPVHPIPGPARIEREEETAGVWRRVCGAVGVGSEEFEVSDGLCVLVLFGFLFGFLTGEDEKLIVDRTRALMGSLCMGRRSLF